MNLRQIEFALAVAETGSFTRAAQCCHTVQSALSHQIARLEEELGARLFERTSRHVALTPAGRAFVTHAREVREATDRLRAEMAAAVGEIRGTLAIGTISTLTMVDLPALLARYHRRYPQVDIRLGYGMSHRMLQAMRGQDLDVAFLGLWAGERVEGVEARLLSEEALMAVMHPAHPLAAARSIRLAALAEVALVDHPAGTAARQQTDRAFEAAGVERKVKFEADHAELIEGIVREGLAVGLVPQQTAPWLKGLACIAVEDSPQRRVYFACTHNPTPAAAAFRDLVLETVAAGEGAAIPR
jgi:DNA-binding transcriptional LysR family regulator